MDPSSLVPGVKVDPDILNYIYTLPKKNGKHTISFPEALQAKLHKLAAEQMNEMNKAQAATFKMTKTVTHQGSETSQLIPWSDASVTKREADAFKKQLIKENWIWGEARPGPLTELILPKSSHGMVVSKFSAMSDKTLTDKNVLFAGEQCAIWLYTYQTYLLLNGTLSRDTTSLRQWMREEMQLDPDVKTSQTYLQRCQKSVPLITEMAISGINKLPPFTGTLYRGDAMTKEQLEEWKKGKFLVTQKLFSCSTIEDVGEYFAKASALSYMRDEEREYKPVLYGIAGTQAKSISAFSKRPDESEYVYPPGQIFHSIEVDETTIPGLAIIYLQESRCSPGSSPPR